MLIIYPPQSPYAVIAPVANNQRGVSVVGGTTCSATVNIALVIGVPSIVICPDLTTISATGDLECNGFIDLTGFYAPKLATIEAGGFFALSSGNSPDPTQFHLPSLTVLAGDIAWTDMAWTAAEVATILSQLNATLVSGGGTIDLSGNNASPTGGAANADYLALGVKGFTVTIN